MDTKASTGGRRITLDPLMERAPLEVHPVRVESSLPAGLRVEWMSGGDNAGTEVDLTCGAGFGNPYLILVVKHPEHGTIEEIIDIGDLCSRWVQAAIDAGRTPVVQ